MLKPHQPSDQLTKKERIKRLLRFAASVGDSTDQELIIEAAEILAEKDELREIVKQEQINLTINLTINMGTYNFDRSQIQAVGDGAQGHGDQTMNLLEIANGIDPKILAQQLEILINAVVAKQSEGDHSAALAILNSAKTAAEGGKVEESVTILQKLGSAGKTVGTVVWEMAKGVGVKLLADVIKDAIGIR